MEHVARLHYAMGEYRQALAMYEQTLDRDEGDGQRGRTSVECRDDVHHRHSVCQQWRSRQGACGVRRVSAVLATGSAQVSMCRLAMR